MKRCISYPVGLAGMTVLAMSSAGCAAGETFDAPDKATLAEDSRTMAKIFESRADKETKPFMDIDLTDERQYRFVRNRLLASGNTPETSPHLFEILEARHHGKQPPVDETAAQAVANSEKDAIATQSATTTSFCGHFLLLEEYTNNTHTVFRPDVVMSCFGGASYAYVDGIAFVTPDIQGSNYSVLAQNSIEQYNGGRSVVLQLGTPTQANPQESEVYFDDDPNDTLGILEDPNKTFVLDSLAIAEKNGVQHFTYATVQTMGPGGPIVSDNQSKSFRPIQSIKLDHPTKVINSTNDPHWFDFYCGTNLSGKNPYKLKTYKNYPDYEAGFSYTCPSILPAPGSPLPKPPPGAVDRVRVCLERGYTSAAFGQIDCDYAAVQDSAGQLFPFKYPFTGMAATSPNSMATGELKMNNAAYWPTLPKYEANTRYIPVKGSVELNYPGSCVIDSYDTAFTQAELVLYEDGGFCGAGKNGDAIGSTLWEAMTTEASGVRANFNMLGNFGGNCYGSSNTKRMHFYAIVYAKTKGVGGTVCGNRYMTTRVTPVDFFKSCFAEGTEIRRADGTLLPVEQFRKGDKVIANSSGLALTVTGFVAGTESNPIVNLYDNLGHDLFVTEEHPIVTRHKGVVKAGDLVEGDEVMTEDGPAVLTAVQRVAYDRQVFNLSLGTPDELARAGKDNRTMFAEGYLVGDNEMQTEVDRALKPRREKIASVWERDYQYDVKHGRTAAP